MTWWIWLRTLVFASIVVATALIYVPRWITGPGRQVAGEPARAGGVVLIVLGAALMIWCWTEFVLRGRGTPAPYDPPRRLVVVGPYRYVRNPMYIAAILVVLGQAALFSSLPLVGYATVFAAASFAFVIGYEEQTLARRFGADYAAYRAAVRRWLPRLRPYNPGAMGSPTP